MGHLNPRSTGLCKESRPCVSGCVRAQRGGGRTCDCGGAPDVCVARDEEVPPREAQRTAQAQQQQQVR
jgi:hypothetical protein